MRLPQRASRRAAGRAPCARSARSGLHSARARERTVARGILDSYRQSQQGATLAPPDDGAAAAEEQASATFVVESQPPVLTFESVDEGVCPAECVTEIFSAQEFKTECQDAGEALVVVDFFKTSCGACKYLLPGFLKICKATYGDEANPHVVFLKHNVFDDEEDEKTDLARRLKISSVPKFMFFRNMEVVEEFATRDRQRVAEAIAHHTDGKVTLLEL